MKRNGRSIRSTLLLLLVLMLLASAALAGSPGSSFSGSFNYAGDYLEDVATKTDAGTSSGNYATVVTRSVFFDDGSGTLTYRVRTIDGYWVTNSVGVSGAGSVSLPYVQAVTNGSLVLRCTSSSAGTAGGSWYP